MVNVYQGPNSWYARKEGFYVKRIERPGIDTIREAVAILSLILRDAHRGWTYDRETGHKVRMTKQLFVRRVKYILTLAKKHGATANELKIIRMYIGYTLKRGKLPKHAKSLAEKMIVKVK